MTIKISLKMATIQTEFDVVARGFCDLGYFLPNFLLKSHTYKPEVTKAFILFKF